MSLGTKIKEGLGLRRSVVGMLAMVVLVGMGEHLAERFLPLYLQQLTTSATAILAIGLLAWLDDFLSALYSFPGGYLTDHLGHKRALLVFNLVSIAGYLIVIFIHTWWAVLLGAAFFISWSALSLPATMELIAQVVPKNKRTMGVSVQSLVRRFPKMLGPVTGGMFITIWGVERGVQLAFVLALALALLAIVLQQILIAEGQRSEKAAEKNPLKLWRQMNGDLRNLLVSDILIRFCERIPDAFVVVWCCRAIIAHPVTELQFGWLSAVEQMTAVLCYIPVAYWADRLGKKPFVLATFVFFTLFPLTLLGAQSFWPLLGAFVMRGLKEFGEPTRKALILDLAPEDRRAAMFGLYYLVRDVVVSFAALGGAGLWAINPRLNLLVAFGFGVIGTIWFAFQGRDVKPANR
ncbi:MAG TPA: MFS transporter [Dongiaceae bacterium]|nr:MFS transporter [Dongiaceae bacterium]